jgi:hypothetical protein
MSSRKSSSKPNGHAGTQGRPNGHAPASTDGSGIPAGRDQAASDDDSRASVTGAAGSGTAPGTDCEAYAVAAPLLPIGASDKAGSKQRAKDKEPPPLPGGELSLPLNPGEFVEEIHRNADLLIAWKRLLNSKDEKVRQRAVEKVTEMRYKGAAALADEPQQIIFDLPRPKRD